MKAVLFMEGGVIQKIISDGELEVRIIDGDTEGEEAEVQLIEGKMKYVFNSNRIAEVDKVRTETIFKEIESNENTSN